MSRSSGQRLRFILFTLGTLCLGAFMHAACKDSTSHASNAKNGDSEEALAKIDDVTITLGEFQDRINKQSPYVRARYTSLERKKEFLDNLVRFEVLAKEADKRGLSKDPEVIRTMKQVMVQKLLAGEFDKMKVDDITDPECKTYYDAHPVEFNQPEEVRVSSIVVKDQAAAKKVMADARIKGVDNQGFRTLVSEYSQDQATKDRGGDLRYFSRNTKDVPTEIVDAAFKLTNIGDVSPPVKTSVGLAILKLTGRRKALVRTFDEVKQQIRNKIWGEKRKDAMEAFVKRLRDGSKIKIDEAKLAKVQIEGTGSGFPGPGVPPPGQGQFHPGAPGVPSANPLQPGNPNGASAVTMPPPGSPVAPSKPE
jgi:peptidyl-prolyl cis-trans isomerase C